VQDQTRLAVVKRYEGYGLIAGLGLGALVGVLFAGPHFRDWPAAGSLLAILGGGVGGALIGYLAVAIFIGSLVHGPGIGEGGGADISQGGNSSHGNGGGGSGDGGGGGGDGGSDG